MAGSLRAARRGIFCKKGQRRTRRCSAVPNSIVLFQMMLPAEPFAHPVHPAPQQNREHHLELILQRADQRLPRDSHHGLHQPLA